MFRSSYNRKLSRLQEYQRYVHRVGMKLFIIYWQKVKPRIEPKQAVEESEKTRDEGEENSNVKIRPIGSESPEKYWPVKSEKPYFPIETENTEYYPLNPIFNENPSPRADILAEVSDLAETNGIKYIEDRIERNKIPNRKTSSALYRAQYGEEDDEINENKIPNRKVKKGNLIPSRKPRLSIEETLNIFDSDYVNQNFSSDSD